MSLGDWIRQFFARRANPALTGLEGFIAERKGLEGYLEPETPTHPMSLLLVDRYGEHSRAPVRTGEQAASFCDQHGIPLYDAQVVGYPKRMRDFESRRSAPQGDKLDEAIADLERRLQEAAPPDTPDR